MNKTRIETTDYTWNPVTGCLGPAGDGKLCSYCYAARLARGRLQGIYRMNRQVIHGPPTNAFSPRWWPRRLPEPADVAAPSRIFVCDMADLFGPWVPDYAHTAIFNTVEMCPQHTFMFLTKWPQNLRHFNPWPENAWVGATATDAHMAHFAVSHLRQVNTTVRFLSVEPLLSHIDGPTLDGLDWVIIGGQTGKGAVAPKKEWVDELVTYARYYAVPLFLKNALRWPDAIQEWPLGDDHGLEVKPEVEQRLRESLTVPRSQLLSAGELTEGDRHV